MPEQGDIVLVPVPFTDLSSRKRRPVIVVPDNAYNRGGTDVIVVAMTSNPAAVSMSLPISSADLAEGAPNRPGMVRADKIYTLAKSIVVKKSGRVSPQVVQRIRPLRDTVTAPGP